MNLSVRGSVQIVLIFYDAALRCQKMIPVRAREAKRRETDRLVEIARAETSEPTAPPSQE